MVATMVCDYASRKRVEAALEGCRAVILSVDADVEKAIETLTELSARKSNAAEETATIELAIGNLLLKTCRHRLGREKFNQAEYRCQVAGFVPVDFNYFKSCSDESGEAIAVQENGNTIFVRPVAGDHAETAAESHHNLPSQSVNENRSQGETSQASDVDEGFLEEMKVMIRSWFRRYLLDEDELADYIEWFQVTKVHRFATSLAAGKLGAMKALHSYEVAGNVAIKLKHMAKADEIFREGLAIARNLGLDNVENKFTMFLQRIDLISSLERRAEAIEIIRCVLLSVNSDFVAAADCLKTLPQTLSQAPSLELRIEVKVAIGTFCTQIGRFEEAETVLCKAEQVSKQEGYFVGEIVGAGFIGINFLSFEKAKEKAKDSLLRCMTLVLEHKYELPEDFLQHPVAHFAAMLLNIFVAMKEFEVCINLFSQLFDIVALKTALFSKAKVHLDLGISFAAVDTVLDAGQGLHSWERGIRHLLASARMSRQVLDDPQAMKEAVAAYLFAMDTAGKSHSNLERVQEILEQAMEMTHERRTFLQKVCDLAGLYRREKRLTEAIALLDMALKYARKENDEDPEKIFLVALVQISWGEGPWETLEDHKKGIEHLTNAREGLEVQKLTQGEAFSKESLDLLNRCRLHLAKMYRLTQQYEKAVEIHRLCSQTVSDLRQKLLIESDIATALSLSKENAQALAVIREALVGAEAPHLQADWKFQTTLRLTHGRILLNANQRDEGIKAMEAAKLLCETRMWDCEDEIIASCFVDLLRAYHSVGNLASAYSLMDFADPALQKNRQVNTELWVEWELQKGKVLQSIGDVDRAQTCVSDAMVALNSLDIAAGDEEEEEDDESSESHPHPSNQILEDDDPGIRKGLYSRCNRCGEMHVMVNASNQLLRLKQFASTCGHVKAAIRALDVAEKVVTHRLGKKPALMASLHMQRGLIYLQSADHKLEAGVEYKKAEHELKTLQNELKTLQQSAAVEYELAEVENELAVCYFEQVMLMLREKKVDEALSLLEKSRQLSESCVDPAWDKYVEARVLHQQEKYEDAAELAQASALLLLEKQAEFKSHMESAWVFSLENLMDVLELNENLSVFLDRALPALLWAERSRMRLFMRIIETQASYDDLAVKMNMKLFDSDYTHAEELLGDAVKACGENTAIIQYSCWEENHSRLYCYLTYVRADEQIFIHCNSSPLDKIFAEKRNQRMGKTLSSLIANVRTAIREDRTEKAITGLSILHSILIKSIQCHLPDCCKTLVFSPQGSLSLVPFQALYDDTKREFLIQQRMVCVIPSIRALHHCFQRQRLFEQNWSTLEKPLVAGNPEPMGLQMDQLKGAKEEAENIAGTLRGQLCVGNDMTKAAVMKGLSASSVVVLSTHCVLKPPYAQGAIVLRGNKDLASHPLLEDRVRAVLSAGDSQGRAGSSFQFSGGLEDAMADEVLTAKEIAASRIRAGLVVLSCCQSGQGEVTHEGVLGLGRAFLQAGTATTVLALWKVDDLVTKDLISGMFTNMHESDMDVSQALQKVMVDMIAEGKSMRLWAPFFAFGSPSMQLPSPSLKLLNFTSTITSF